MGVVVPTDGAILPGDRDDKKEVFLMQERRAREVVFGTVSQALDVKEEKISDEMILDADQCDRVGQLLCFSTGAIIRWRSGITTVGQMIDQIAKSGSEITLALWENGKQFARAKLQP